MNPASLTRQVPQSLVQDVKPPYEAAASPSSVSVKTELVTSIPVKDQAVTHNLTVPAQNPLTANHPAISRAADKDLDKVLKEVNKDVKNMDAPHKLKFSLAHLKSSGLILPVAGTVLVAIILIAVSILAFRPAPDSVRTRSTVQTGS